MRTNRLRQGLHLKTILLGMIGRQVLIQHNDSAETVARGQHQTLAVRGPDSLGKQGHHRSDKKTNQVMSVNSS